MICDSNPVMNAENIVPFDGGTVLGGAVWAAVHEPKPSHSESSKSCSMRAHVLRKLCPSGNEQIDQILRRYNAVT